jgi:hypothetical protein
MPKAPIISRRQKVYPRAIADEAVEQNKGPTPKSVALPLGERP